MGEQEGPAAPITAVQQHLGLRVLPWPLLPPSGPSSSTRPPPPLCQQVPTSPTSVTRPRCTPRGRGTQLCTRPTWSTPWSAWWPVRDAVRAGPWMPGPQTVGCRLRREVSGCLFAWWPRSGACFALVDNTGRRPRADWLSSRGGRGICGLRCLFSARPPWWAPERAAGGTGHHPRGRAERGGLSLEGERVWAGKQRNRPSAPA